MNLDTQEPKTISRSELMRAGTEEVCLEKTPSRFWRTAVLYPFTKRHGNLPLGIVKDTDIYLATMPSPG